MASNLGMASLRLSTSRQCLTLNFKDFVFVFRYFCPGRTTGKYIYVGKFNGNNDYLHFTHLTAYRFESGCMYISTRCSIVHRLRFSSKV